MSKHRLRYGGTLHEEYREKNSSGGTGDEVGRGLSRFRRQPLFQSGMQLFQLSKGDTPKISDKEFGKIFNLFITAVDHEVSRNLTIFQRLDYKREADVDELANTYKRLVALSLLSSGVHIRDYWRYLSKASIKRLGLDKSRKAIPDIKAIKEITLDDLRIFKYLLSELSTNYKQTFAGNISTEQLSDLNKVVEYGATLADCLQTLMLDRFDFSAYLMELPVKKIFHYLDDSSERKMRHADIARYNEIKDIHVRANPFFCTLIFTNVFANAKRAMEKIGIEPEIETTIRQENGMVVFEIKDRGCGMPQLVMEMLNTGISVTTKQEEGKHGIGFHYCRELAERMGGKLYIKESSPEGTTVVLELQAAQIK